MAPLKTIYKMLKGKRKRNSKWLRTCITLKSG